MKAGIARIITRYAKLANVDKIQSKSLRHSSASCFINEFNVSVLALSQRLGHSSPEITLKHYNHMWSRDDVGITEKMAGNIKIETSVNTYITFNGNQVIKKDRL